MGGEVYLPNPQTPGGKPVDFGMRLDDANGNYLLSEILPDSLARNAGIHDGDVLVDINGTNIEGWQVQNILDILRTKVKPKLLLTVKRQCGPDKYVFVWTYFKLTIDDNHPVVDILYLTQTKKDIRPWIDGSACAEGNGYSSLGEPVSAFDISLDKDPALYLSIDKCKAKFVSTYNGVSSAFYKYNYVGPGEPGDGVVVAYSLQKPDEHPVSNCTTPAAEPRPNASPTMGVMNFPKSMLGKNIPPNPRFWYQKANNGGEFSLQSVQQKGWYMAKSTSNNDAVVSSTPQYFSIAPSESMRSSHSSYSEG